MKKVISLVFLMSAFSLLQTAQADALQDLLALLEPVKGIQADFVQEVVNAKGEVQQQNKGELKAKEPNQFYWKTSDPFPQEIMTDGKTLWVYDPDLQQVAVKPFEENYSKTPAMLFAGNAVAISQQFTVEKINGVVQGFRLLPKQQRDLFLSLDLVFENSVPASMTIQDAMQQKTTISFSQVTVNPSLVSDLFHFVPPAGVEVLQTKAQ
ncbi:MAG: outer membrane lipoprotein chaperone LolA [Pseudomonadales bacterium]